MTEEVHLDFKRAERIGLDYKKGEPVNVGKPEAENCELVGKSPEEQAATLRRCVGMMDAPKGALR